MSDSDSDSHNPAAGAEETAGSGKSATGRDPCWFCGAEQSDAALPVPIYRVVRTRDRSRRKPGTAFDVDTIPVPRCAACRSAHTRAKWCIAILTALGIVGGLLAFDFAALRVPHGHRLGAVIAIGFAFLGFAAGDRVGRWLFVRGVKPESAKTQYPSVKRHLGEGWRVGRRPGTPPADRRPARPDRAPRVKRRKRARRSPGDAPDRPSSSGAPRGL